LNAQRLDILLGKVLRLDVSSDVPQAPADNPFVGQAEAMPEIWASGLRNPWRFSFDRETHELYIADVGDTVLEEIDLQPAESAGGENYGWSIYEGTYKKRDEPDTGFTWPIFEVGHDVGFCAIIGGYVYRGAALPELTGKYIFGDYCTGQIWALTRNNDDWTIEKLIGTPFQITSFGEDASGEIYVLGAEGGVYQLAPPSP
jgi:glucose/arabinose dehydrogenase